MKSILSEIIETALFGLFLYIVLWISLSFGLQINLLYVLTVLIVLWVVAKIIFRRWTQK